MKVLHFEDEPPQAVIVRKYLEKFAPGVKYVNFGAPYVASIQIELEEPDLLICDYHFKNRATLKDGLVQAIRSFEGPVFIFTSEAEWQVKNTLEMYGVSPDRVEIYSKAETPLLTKAIVNSIEGIKV